MWSAFIINHPIISSFTIHEVDNPWPYYHMITFPPRCATIVHGGAFLTLNQSSYHINSHHPEGGQPLTILLSGGRPQSMVEPPSLPLGQSRSRSLSASQTSLARCSITLSYQKPNLSLTLSIRIQIDLLHTKVWFKTCLLFFLFKNVSAASPGWVASSPTSSPPAAQKPGFLLFKIPEMGQMGR